MPLQGMGLTPSLLFSDSVHPLQQQLPWEAVRAMSASHGLYHYANDFVDYLGPVAAGTAGSWVCTAVGTPTLGLSFTQPGGVLALVTSATLNDLINLQRSGEDFKHVAGKQSGFFTRVAPGLATTTVDLLFGLCITDTSLIVTLPSDGLFFTKLAAANRFQFEARKANASTTVAVVDQQDVALNAFAIYGFIIGPGGAVDVYWGSNWSNVRRVGGIAAGNANIPNVEELTLSFALRATAAASRMMSIDSAAYWREL